MIWVDGTLFTHYKVTKVSLDLDNCVSTLTCELYEGKTKIKKRDFTYSTNCDVDINGLIEKLDRELKNGKNI